MNTNSVSVLPSSVSPRPSEGGRWPPSHELQSAEYIFIIDFLFYVFVAIGYYH